MRQSHTAVVERDVTWAGAFETEPHEVAWATEAIYFIRFTGREGDAARGCARVQISPDGMHWCDEGASVEFGGEAEVVFVRVCHFGSYLRLAGDVPADASVRVLVYLTLKSQGPAADGFSFLFPAARHRPIVILCESFLFPSPTHALRLKDHRRAA